MMRYMRDSGYLAMLSASDRQRLLLFFITLRITASTQEAIACLFESSPPQLAEQMLAQVGVRSTIGSRPKPHTSHRIPPSAPGAAVLPER